MSRGAASELQHDTRRLVNAKCGIESDKSSERKVSYNVLYLEYSTIEV